MATTLRVQVTLPNANGLPADACTNTWHFKGFTVDPVDAATDAAASVAAFYAAIQSVYSNAVSNNFTFKVYDLLDAEPRAPIHSGGFTITGSTGTPLPNECAICLSYSAPPVSGISQARRRGRIFLGPLDATVLDDTGQAVIQDSITALIGGAADDLRLDGGGASDSQWSVFSPTTAGAGAWDATDLVNATLAVTAGYVDNAFDIQRSRGIAATGRFTWP